ncbi:MAG: chemotaxis-specific protein-glutamate methyltransferase CheB [Candidatus Hodarchaeota archaeon]
MSIDVIIADDSAYLRKSIADILKGSEIVNILEFAKDGEEAIKFVKKFSPDVLVLDLVMPKMNGLDAFKVIMEERPTPTVILSAISPKNLDSSIQALLMGAFDYIIKPGGIGAKDLPRFREELLAKVLLASQSQIKKIFRKEDGVYRKNKSIRQEIVDQIFDFGQYLNTLTPITEAEENQQVIDIGKTKEVQKELTTKSIIKQTEKVDELRIEKSIKPKDPVNLSSINATKPFIRTSLQKSLPSLQKRKEPPYNPNLTPIKGVSLTSNIIVIGASVGGPRTITTILKEIPRNFPAPILVVQHLSAHFTEAFADNLDMECKLKVKVATNGEYIKPREIYIAPGESHMEISVDDKRPCIKIYKGKPVNFCMPSIDVLFYSAARVYRDRTMGVLLTGMGSDGVEGLASIQKVGGKTISESEETSILFAMPKFAAEKGYADLVLPNYSIYSEIIKFGRK